MIALITTVAALIASLLYISIIAYNKTLWVQTIDSEKAENQAELTTPDEIKKNLTNSPNLAEPVDAESAVWSTYVILESMKQTSETLSLPKGSHNIDYVKVSCNVRYVNHPYADYLLSSGQTTATPLNSLYDVTAVYIPSATVQEYITHNMVLIKMNRIIINDYPYYFPTLDNNYEAEYLPIDNDVIFIRDDDFLRRSPAFLNICVLNDYLDEVSISIAQGRLPTEAEKKLPKTKISNGISLQEIIDFFEAYNSWKEYIIRNRNPYSLR